MNIIAAEHSTSLVSTILDATPFIDIHTHLFAPAFGKIGLWGIDELVTYHYLEAELFRSATIHPTKYWGADEDPARRLDLEDPVCGEYPHVGSDTRCGRRSPGFRTRLKGDDAGASQRIL